CERVQSSSLAQSLHLINSNEIKSKLAAAGGRAEALAASDEPLEDRIRSLYILAFSRPPREDELQTALAYFAESTIGADGQPVDPEKAERESFQDLIWALINTKEFRFNHEGSLMIALASSLRRTALVLGLGGVLLRGSNAAALAQAVCLPAPRLLTTKPMGGQVGTEVDITITGQHLENVQQLVFSDPRITAVPKLDDAGQPVPDTYVVTIAEDCPVGIYEARAFTRLGLSS